MDIEKYRGLLEACLADKLIALEGEVEDATNTFDSSEQADRRHIAELLRFEVNGLCLALRLIGDYGTTCFDFDWATRCTRPKADWEAALNLSYARPIQRY